MTTNLTHIDFEKRVGELEISNAELRGEVARLEELLAQERKTATRLQLDQGRAIQQALRMRATLDAIPAMIGYWDKNLINGFANKAYLAWFGLAPAKVQGKHIRDVIGEERYRLNLPYIEKALNGEPQTFERAIPAPDGSTVRHSMAQYIPDFDNGKVVGFYALVSDISLAKEFEAALRLSEERYRSVVEDQTEVISRFNADGTLTFVNESYCRLFGKKADEIIGSKWHPITHPEDIDRINSELGQLTPTHPVIAIENRIYSGSGATIWMQFTNRGIFSNDGRLVEIQSVGRDISERKQVEAALIEARDKLEIRVIERTEQLRQLAVKATLAEEHERQAIARDLHDDLGQILHVARIKLDSLIKSSSADGTPELEDLLALITDSSRLVRSLTSQLSPPILHDLGLGAALNWLCDEMERNYGLPVRTVIEDIPVQLNKVESVILFRAARELLINVAKHAESYTACIELKFSEPFLLLSVEDDGVGIKNIDSVFSRNQGFGLSSIRERIIFLGGTTNIISKAEGGIRAELKIPVNLTKFLKRVNP
jgi:PAS domain S-box-containing protein